MKAFMYLWLGLMAMLAFGVSAQLSREETVDLRFNNAASHWIEATLTNVSPEGKITMSGLPSTYAANYAEYHRQLYAIPELRREMDRKKLHETFKNKLVYTVNADYTPETYRVMLPNEKFSIFDESTRFGIAFDTWNYLEEPLVYHVSDLKPGQRYVVGLDADNNVLSMYRINPVGLASAENPAKQAVPPGNERNMKNGTHIMNLSSNETNPPPRVPNTGTSTVNGDNRTGYGSVYTPVVPPVRGTTSGSSVDNGVLPNQPGTTQNPSNINVTPDTLPTNTPPNSSLAPTLPPNTNSTNSTATTPSVNNQNPQAINAVPNTPQSSVNSNGNNGTVNPVRAPVNPTPSSPASPTPAPRGAAPTAK